MRRRVRSGTSCARAATSYTCLAPPPLASRAQASAQRHQLRSLYTGLGAVQPRHTPPASPTSPSTIGRLARRVFSKIHVHVNGLEHEEIYSESAGVAGGSLAGGADGADELADELADVVADSPPTPTLRTSWLGRLTSRRRASSVRCTRPGRASLTPLSSLLLPVCDLSSPVCDLLFSSPVFSSPPFSSPSVTLPCECRSVAGGPSHPPPFTRTGNLHPVPPLVGQSRRRLPQHVAGRGDAADG